VIGCPYTEARSERIGGLRGRRPLRSPRGQCGFTVIELVTAMAILLVVLTAIASMLTSGTKAEIEMNHRFQAQQEARLAVDRMRREIHCSEGVTLSSASSITVALAASCPTAQGSAQNVVYDTVNVSSGRFQLRRAGVRVADYLTSGDVFSYVVPSATTLGKLQVDLPVDLTPTNTLGRWELRADIVLRNTARA
jgi:prepilin-type N-terminal cleavage/methylation domain-containing protein